MDKEGRVLDRSAFAREIGTSSSSPAMTKDDPRIYVEVVDELDKPIKGVNQTRLVLHNRGGQVAHNIEIESLKIAGHEVTFVPVSDLDRDARKEITPQIESTGVMQNADLVGLVIKAWNSVGDLTEEFPLELCIRYRDFSLNKRFVSKIKLAFSPLQASFMRRNPSTSPAGWKAIEVEDISFSRLPSE